MSDILFYFFLGHTKTVIADGQGFGVLIHAHFNAGSERLIRGLSNGLEPLQLLDGVTAVGYQLPQEDILIGIEPFFNDGEQILRIDTDVASACHSTLPPMCDSISI